MRSINRAEISRLKASAQMVGGIAGQNLHQKRFAAEMCGVTQQFVSKMAKELGAGLSYNNGKMREVTRNGVTYTQNTANIGSPLTKIA